MMETTVATLEAGDVFRFTEDSAAHTLTGVHPHPQYPALCNVDLSGGIRVTTALTTPVFAVKQERIVRVPCLLCKETYSVLHDHAKSGGTVHAVLCTSCDAMVTAKVAQLTEGTTDQADDEKCTHPNGFGRYGCPCGATSSDDDDE